MCDEKGTQQKTRIRGGKLSNVSIWSKSFWTNPNEADWHVSGILIGPQGLQPMMILTLKMLAPKRNQKHLELAFQLV